MTRATIRGGPGGVRSCVSAAAVAGAATTSSTQTKEFEMIAVNGNRLVVKLPEGTRELDRAR